MKKIYAVFILFFGISLGAAAQTDTIVTVITAADTIHYNKNEADTIKIGKILFIKMKRPGSGEQDSSEIIAAQLLKKKKSNTWVGVDLGFSNFTDATNYAGNDFIVNGLGNDLSAADFKPRTGKSVNVNIWLFMQRLNLIKENVNLKYGLGLELNNYRFRSGASFAENGIKPYTGGLQTNAPFAFRDSVSFSKNKLALDYLTVPLMLNFATNNNLQLSAGISAGYLYSQRNKQVNHERNKQKNKGDYDFERFKISYIGEVGLGNVMLYGSYTPKSIHPSLSWKPYNVGLRFNLN